MMTDEEPNDAREQDDEQRKREELDLTLENQALENDLKALGMMAHGKADDLDPALENEFLRSVKMFEEMDQLPKDPIFSLFPPDFGFPPVDSMSGDDLVAKVAAIEDILARQRIYLELHDGIPLRDVYSYIVDEVLANKIMFADTSLEWNQRIDGCSGCCEECFQRPYCETADEIEKEFGLGSGDGDNLDRADGNGNA